MSFLLLPEGDQPNLLTKHLQNVLQMFTLELLRISCFVKCMLSESDMPSLLLCFANGIGPLKGMSVTGPRATSELYKSKENKLILGPFSSLN